MTKNSIDRAKADKFKRVASAPATSWNQDAHKKLHLLLTLKTALEKYYGRGVATAMKSSQNTFGWKMTRSALGWLKDGEPLANPLASVVKIQSPLEVGTGRYARPRPEAVRLSPSRLCTQSDGLAVVSALWSGVGPLPPKGKHCLAVSLHTTKVWRWPVPQNVPTKLGDDLRNTANSAWRRSSLPLPAANLPREVVKYAHQR